MAIFEKDRGSRRFFSLSTDDFPTAPGGIPTGSFLTYTNTGDRFIYDGNNREWLPFVGVEDTINVLEEIRDTLGCLLAHAAITRAATATMANDQSDGNYPTDDE